MATSRGAALALSLAGAACASSGPVPISPADLSRLQAEAAANPTDGIATLRLAAAMQASGRLRWGVRELGNGA